MPQENNLDTQLLNVRKPNAKVLIGFVAIVALLVVLITRTSRVPEESDEYLNLAEKQEELLSKKGELEDRVADLEEKMATPTDLQEEIDATLQKVIRWEEAIKVLKLELGK